MLKTGYIHVYTGNGKGKTTAALGLALRASGAGLKVYIQQFAKSCEYSEIKALRKIPGIKVSQCGNGTFIFGKPKISDIECAKRGFRDAKKKILSGRYDLVVLDEINVAMKFGLVSVRSVMGIIKHKPKSVELVLTGRGCPPSIKNIADLVTEMREVKHPYRQGIAGRKGVEY
ncbi:MAG: cob(I)yrinic acid a,c-diamide adenosyltransferase [Candidatus Omnitrophica bacterium]|nr:cob(I)yrinic acid a,c-diamide adenosyltransferase [Candidatus Omnitrophota bacterium]